MAAPARLWGGAVAPRPRNMTFSVVLASRTSVWACTDRQLTDPRPGKSGPTGVKITAIHADGGFALMAYAGVGRVRDTQVSRWVYRTLVGKGLTLEDAMVLVADAAQRRLAPFAPRVRGGHFFIASAIRPGAHCLYAIDVAKTSARPRERIEARGRNHSQFAVTGSGAPIATEFERSRLVRISRLVRRHNMGKLSAEAIAFEFAALNIAVSSRMRSMTPPNQTVSAESVVAVINRRPRRMDAGDLRQWCFDANGTPAADPVERIPEVSRGIPLSDIVDAMGEVLRQGQWREMTQATHSERFAAMNAETTAAISGVSAKPDEQFR